MGTRWICLLSNLWRRLGFELVWPWRSEERLHLSVGRLYTYSHQQQRFRSVDYDHTGHLVPLLDRSHGPQWGVREDHRLVTFYGNGPRLGPGSWTIPSEGDSTITVTFDGTARYSDCE